MWAKSLTTKKFFNVSGIFGSFFILFFQFQFADKNIHIFVVICYAVYISSECYRLFLYGKFFFCFCCFSIDYLIVVCNTHCESSSVMCSIFFMQTNYPRLKRLSVKYFKKNLFEAKIFYFWRNRLFLEPSN